MQYYSSWIRDIEANKNKTEKNAARLLCDYTGCMNIPYNQYLRGLECFNEEEVREYFSDTAIITNEIRKFDLQENIIAFRYTHKQLFGLLFELKRPKVGQVFTDKGFMSTTLVGDLLKDFAKNRRYNCVLKLYLPKGTKGAYIRFNDSLLNEHEFLLPPNSRFLLTGKHINCNLHTVYECELLSQ